MSTSQPRPERPAHHQSPSTTAYTTEYVGDVAVTGPNPRGYYRLKWREPDGTLRDTSGSRDLDFARIKASDIDSRLAQAAGPKATSSLQHILDEFIADGHSPYKDKMAYKQAQVDGLKHKLTRGLRGLRGQGGVRAMDLDRSICDLIRQQAGTHNGVTENTSALRAYLRWGYQHQYFTAAQAELLPRAGAIPEPALRTVRTRLQDGTEDREDPGAAGGSTARINGAAADYVKDEDCPDAGQLESLRDEMQRHFPRWGGLACEFAANSGARWGEQFQLRATDVHLAGCQRYARPHVHVNWQIASTKKAGKDGAGNRRDRPKGRKTRVVPIPTLSITGYRLRDELSARVAAAKAEKAAGTNPEALLFPADRGGLLWHSSFYGDHLLPAMIAAGLPVETWQVTEHVWDETQGDYVIRTRIERHAVYSWHSLRHRFARICVDIHQMSEGKLMAIGGWENINTVQTRYYRSGDDNMNGGLAHFD